MGYEVIEHTADLGIRIWAPDLDALFAQAAAALVAVMGEATGPYVHREQIALDAPDREALLVDWLSEILFLFEARGVAPGEVEVKIAAGQPWRLTATVRGPDAAEGFSQHGPQVKAVTYHALEVRDSPGGVEARVYLDV